MTGVLFLLPELDPAVRRRGRKEPSVNRSPLRFRRRRRLTVPRALAVVLGLTATGIPAVLAEPAAAEAVHKPSDDPLVAGTEDFDDVVDLDLRW
ncbi:hypothetical protein GCM10022221_75810 [Actinocorallia aurea]